MSVNYNFYPDQHFQSEYEDLDIPISIFFKTSEEEIDECPLPRFTQKPQELQTGIINFPLKK